MNIFVTKYSKLIRPPASASKQPVSSKYQSISKYPYLQSLNTSYCTTQQNQTSYNEQMQQFSIPFQLKTLSINRSSKKFNKPSLTIDIEETPPNSHVCQNIHEYIEDKQQTEEILEDNFEVKIQKMKEKLSKLEDMVLMQRNKEALQKFDQMTKRKRY